MIASENLRKWLKLKLVQSDIEAKEKLIEGFYDYDEYSDEKAIADLNKIIRKNMILHRALRIAMEDKFDFENTDYIEYDDEDDYKLRCVNKYISEYINYGQNRLEIEEAVYGI